VEKPEKSGHDMMEVLVQPFHLHSSAQMKETSSGLTFALQALIHRHESYVSESQQEHQRLTAYITELEQERTTLQTTNDKIVEENRQLLTQLESANTSLKDSDVHVKSLEALLRDCELEVKRLTALSRRTEELEYRLLELEKDRASFATQVNDQTEETRSTVKRWRESEARVRQLEIEVQRIEFEAKKDKERYEEIIARLERERVLERELGGAEGRLKGAAAVRGLNGKDKSPNVVSHFVRDILQDNANLQAGIVELRDLLQTSNEEVQNLREQVLQHQPLEVGEGENLSRSVPLSEHLGWAEPSPTPKVQQALHVHHHYHAKPAKRERTPTVRRSSRRRAVIAPGMLPSTPESSAPATPLVAPQRYASSPILPTSLYHPQPMRNRWSMQSGATASSVISSYPSSPRSYSEQQSSIFDRLEPEEESSRPTSPESVGLATSPLKVMSPNRFGARHNYQGMIDGRLDEEDSENVDAEEVTTLLIDNIKQDVSAVDHEAIAKPGSNELTPKPSQLLFVEKISDISIPQKPPDANPVSEAEETVSVIYSVQPTDQVANKNDRSEVVDTSLDPIEESHASPGDFDPTKELLITPTLRRSNSHESLVSISGMDIHLAKRPEPSADGSKLFSGNKAYFAGPPSAARRVPSAQPLTTVTEYTALSSLRSFSTNLPPSPRDNISRPQPSSSIAALSGIAGLHTPPPSEQASHSGLGRLVGSWVTKKWGIAPIKSNVDLRSSAASISTTSSTSTATQGQTSSSLNFPGGRLPGINQSGPIPGLFKTVPRSMGVQVKMMSEEGLRESLAEP
jgi:hypothetical protein